MSPNNGSLHIERGVALRAYNTFGLPAVAHTLVRVGSDSDVRRVVDHPELGRAKKLILGAGSNLILSRDPDCAVVKVEIMGKRLVSQDDAATVIEAGAGETWHDVVAWALQQGWHGLETLARIPG